MRVGLVVATMMFGAFVGLMAAPRSAAVVVVPPGTIDPTTIPQWVTTLTGAPPVYSPTVVTDGDGNVVRHEYTVDMTAFDQQILPAPLPKTHVWGYGGVAQDAVTGESLGPISNSPAPSFEAVRGVPVEVRWQNKISEPYMFCVDPSLHWADPNNMGMMMGPMNFDPCPPGYEQAQSPAPLVPHAHGMEVDSRFDGGPTAWFTYNGIHGSTYSTLPGAGDNEAIYRYENEQLPTTLWYHDHGLGVTRLNVMSGLAGFYLLRDSGDLVEPNLPPVQYEVPLAIQDRIFNTDGSFYYPSVGDNLDMHPYWVPEFFGNTVMVNGLVWPKMNVDQGWYRFRLLDGSNARFYTLSFKPQSELFPDPLPFWVIGSDGGYLKAPAQLTSLTIAPGERYDVLVDFSNLPAGTNVLLSNTAKAPFPNGAAADPRTIGRIMLFSVNGNAGYQMGQDLIAALPTPLNPYLAGATWPTLGPASSTRTLTLWEVMGMAGPLEALLNGQKWSAPVSEKPVAGTTEDWIVVDLTGDTHPIHLHLTTFQVVSRQKIDAAKYSADWLAMNSAKCGVPAPPWPDDCQPNPLAVGPYLRGRPIATPLQEQGWKDTVQMNPGEITILRVRFAPNDGTPEYPFDPSYGPGYVWHCHILEHEDNEMMRPYEVVKP